MLKNMLLAVLFFFCGTVYAQQFPASCHVDLTKKITSDYPAGLKSMDVYYCAMVDLLNSGKVGKTVHSRFVMDFIKSDAKYSAYQHLFNCSPLIGPNSGRQSCPMHVNDFVTGSTHLIDLNGAVALDRDWFLLPAEQLAFETGNNPALEAGFRDKVLNSELMNALRVNQRVFVFDYAGKISVIDPVIDLPSPNSTREDRAGSYLAYQNHHGQPLDVRRGFWLFPKQDYSLRYFATLGHFRRIENCPSANQASCSAFFSPLLNNDSAFMANVARQIDNTTYGHYAIPTNFCLLRTDLVAMRARTKPFICTNTNGFMFDLIYPWQ